MLFSAFYVIKASLPHLRDDNECNLFDTLAADNQYDELLFSTNISPSSNTEHSNNIPSSNETYPSTESEHYDELPNNETPHSMLENYIKLPYVNKTLPKSISKPFSADLFRKTELNERGDLRSSCMKG